MRENELALTILQSISDGVFALNREWRFTYANQPAYRIFERQSGQLLGRLLWEEIPGLAGSAFEQLCRTTMTERTAGSVTLSYPDRAAWYEVHAYPAEPDGVTVHLRDITERIHAEEALRDRIALLQEISDSTGDVIFAKDRAGRFRFANPATLALIGKPLELVLGKTDLELLTNHEAAQRVMDLDRALMVGAVAVEVEEVVPLPDGSRRVWLSRKIPHRDAEGTTIGLLGVSRDITEKKKAWDRVSRLYEFAAALSEAVSRADVAKVTVNQGIAAVGAQAGSLALLTPDGRHLEMAGWIGFRPEVMKQWERFAVTAPVPLAEAVRTGKPVYTESADARLESYPALAPLTSITKTQSSACIPLSVGGTIVGALGLSFERAGPFSDDDREFFISLGRQCVQSLERARLFEAERLARADAERASLMKDDFLATLSHELRTPLNAILGWATILAEGTLAGDDLRSGLLTIERNARAQTKIIEDLLDMSRIISGKVRLEVQTVVLAEILEAAVESVRPAATAKNVRLRSVLDPEAGPVNGDPNRLQQVFFNLLTNAIKFTHKGGQVQVFLQRINSQVEITVADSGEGIAAEFLPHVFERFRQADASTTRRHGGLGLGLAIVKQLVELHGGAVRVTSPGEGRGATFTIELPLSAAHPVHEEGAQERRHPDAHSKHLTDADRARLRGIRILAVDDEPDARALVKRLLEDRGAIVTTAASADEAMASIAVERPDVVISDIGMPQEDGYSLIHKIRALPPDRGGDMPAVALTAYARTEDRVRAMHAGFQTHLVKPVEATELIAVVASLAKRIGK